MLFHSFYPLKLEVHTLAFDLQVVEMMTDKVFNLNDLEVFLDFDWLQVG